MDYIEYEQTAEALKCIENYPLKRSDRETESLLNEFCINDRKAANAPSRNFYNYFNLCSKKEQEHRLRVPGLLNRLNFILTYKEGCSGEQLDMFKAILLSAEYNLSCYAEMTSFAGSENQKNIENLTYDGKGLGELEKLRLEAAGCIKKAYKYAAKVKYINEIGSYIYEGLEKIAEYKMLKETAEEDWFVNTAGRMIKDGVSLIRIVSCLKAEPLRVYNLAKSMNRPFTLSAEEKELIKQKKKL